MKRSTSSSKKSASLKRDHRDLLLVLRVLEGICVSLHQIGLDDVQSRKNVRRLGAKLFVYFDDKRLYKEISKARRIVSEYASKKNPRIDKEWYWNRIAKNVRYWNGISKRPEVVKALNEALMEAKREP